MDISSTQYNVWTSLVQSKMCGHPQHTIKCVYIPGTQYNVWTSLAHISPNMFIYHPRCGWRICFQHLNIKITICQPSLYLRHSDFTQKSVECLEVTKKSGYHGEAQSSKKRHLVRDSGGTDCPHVSIVIEGQRRNGRNSQ